ncbi:MAG: hypothetical protein PHO32_03055 [Candidatus Cloacimonetes bacterium]|nr:hypothetical protein [Candidatus Cloacimonadota bacterium]
MNKSLTLIFLLLLCSSMLLAGDYLIGSGTSTQNKVPVYGYNNYGWSKFLYTSSELSSAGLVTDTLLTRMAFQVSSTTANYAMDNQKIYIRTFYDSSYGSSAVNYPGTSGFTNVYNGSITWNGPGWVEIEFQTPYHYYYGYGLEILWENRDGSKIGGPPSFYYTSLSNSCVYKNQDASFPTANGARGNYHPNIWFVSEATDVPNPAAATLPLSDATNVGINTLLRWNHTGGSPTGYRLWLGTNNPPSNIAAAFILTEANYTPLTYLDYGTTYYWRIVPFNDLGPAVDCPVWSFTTVADPSISEFPYTETFDGAFNPIGWTDHAGALVEPIVLGADGSSQWQSDDWLNIASTDKAAGMNIWGNVSGYFISPLFNVPSDDFVIEFDLALLKYNQPPTGTPPALTGTDDRFAVLIGDGFTWSTANIVKEWNNSGSVYVYNNIPVNGNTIRIPLSGHTGRIKIAIFAGSTISNADNDIMINNFRIGLPSSILTTPELNISLNTINDQAVLSWDTVSGATLYKIYKASDPTEEYQLFDTTNGTSYNLNSADAAAFFKIKAEY